MIEGYDEQKEIRRLLTFTKPADDIRLLTCVISQLRDGYGVASVQIPDAHSHCKYWIECGADDLVRALESKYENGETLRVPPEFMTSF